MTPDHSDLDKALSAAGVPDSIDFELLCDAAVHEATGWFRSIFDEPTQRREMWGHCFQYDTLVASSERRSWPAVQAALARSYVTLLDDATFTALHAAAVAR